MVNVTQMSYYTVSLTPFASGTGIKLLARPYFLGSVTHSGMRTLSQQSSLHPKLLALTPKRLPSYLKG